MLNASCRAHQYGGASVQGRRKHVLCSCADSAPAVCLPALQATASYDMTWRLWDIETGSCLMEQEGHSRQVYSVAFHPDGSLAGSVGLDAYGELC